MLNGGNMIQLGKKQELVVVKKVDFGVYLGETENAEADERVLLPKKQVPGEVTQGDKVLVFVYKDSSDRPIATTKEPVFQLGQTAVLKVAEVGKIGAFLNWGLEKDLFMPYKQMTKRVKEGDECLVALYLDKSSRLCATMKVYHYLKTNSPYVIGDEVKGRIYEVSEQFGVFVAVDDCYSGLIKKQEAQGEYKIGEIANFRITEVKEDGKLNLSAKQKAYLQLHEDAEIVVRVIEEFAGVLPFDDKTSPEVIKREFGLSKNAFKRAVGHLLKENKIEIKNKRIYLTK